MVSKDEIPNFGLTKGVPIYELVKLDDKKFAQKVRFLNYPEEFSDSLTPEATLNDVKQEGKIGVSVSSPASVELPVQLLFEQFLDKDTNVREQARSNAYRISTDKLRRVMSLLLDKWHQTREKSIVEENMDYYGMGLENPTIATAAKEALEYLKALEINLKKAYESSKINEQLPVLSVQSVDESTSIIGETFSVYDQFRICKWVESVGLPVKKIVLEPTNWSSDPDSDHILFGSVSVKLVFKGTVPEKERVLEIGGRSFEIYSKRSFGWNTDCTNKAEFKLIEFCLYHSRFDYYDFLPSANVVLDPLTQQKEILQFKQSVLENKKESTGSASQIDKSDSESSPMPPVPDKKTGGIDFRALPMTIQPMGSFSGLNFKLPQLSQAELRQINVDSEMQQIRNMMQAGIVPSGQRIKELVAACVQKGQINSHIDSLLLCLADTFKLEEENASESSPELREALVIVDSRS